MTRLYRLARFIETPLRKLKFHLDNVASGAWCRDGWEPNRRQLWANRGAWYLNRLRAVVYLWLVPAHAEDWSVGLAAKTTLCLVLGLEPSHDNYYQHLDAGWFTDMPFEKYAHSWESVLVGEGWYNWFATVESEDDDSGYP